MHESLLRNIKRNLPSLEALLKEIEGEWNYEDLVYRFYHQSFKVYWTQAVAGKIAAALWKLAPDGCVMNETFKGILKRGTGKSFKSEHNRRWGVHTRPMLEAFFHARYFLEMAVKYGRKLKKAPQCLPSGWAGLLYLYGLR